jgi:hypothetical protein
MGINGCYFGGVNSDQLVDFVLFLWPIDRVFYEKRMTSLCLLWDSAVSFENALGITLEQEPACLVVFLLGVPNFISFFN